MTTKEKIAVILILLFIIFGKAYDNNIRTQAKQKAIIRAEQESIEHYEEVFGFNPYTR